MALNTFGWTPSEVTTDSAGNVISGVTLTVFTDVTKASQVTTLFDKDGVTALTNGVVVSDNKGRFGFKASDAYSMLYVYDGSTADPWPIAAHEALDQGMASHAQAVADAQAAADSAAASAALVGAPADSAIAAAVNGAASQTRAALDAKFAAQFTATGTTTAADITAWLAASSALGVKRLSGAATIAAPIVIKAGTRLDATGATITSTHAGHMIHNENYASGSTRDKGISIVGGTWQRNAGGNNNDAHSIFLRHVDRLTVRDLTVGSTGGKYMIALGDVTDFHVSDIVAESVNSDTVHMTGPCSDGVVERVRVRLGGDDVVAFTTTDYVSYDDVHGNISNVTVRDITANNATRAVLIAGSASGADDGFTLSNIVVENVRQNGVGAGVSVGSPVATVELGSITLRNVYGEVLLKHKTMGVVTVENCGRVSVAPDATSVPTVVRRLVIREPKAATEAFIVNSSFVTIQDLEVSGANITTGNGVRVLAGTVNTATVRGMKFSGTGLPVEVAGTVDVLNLNGFTGTLGSGRNLVQIAGTIGTLNVTDLRYTGADTTDSILARLASSAAKLTTLNVTGATITTGGRLIEVPNGSTGTINMNLVNVTTSGLNRILQAAGVTFNLTFTNLAANTTLNEAFRIYGSGSLTVRGTGFSGQTGGTIVRGGTETVRVIAQNLPVDLSILAKGNGDAANNTNAALACGVGPAVCNGTNWKNVYSGTTY